MSRSLLCLGAALAALSWTARGATAAELAAEIRAATTGAPEFTIERPRVSAPAKNACSDFGLSTTATGAANYRALAQALAYCKRSGIHTLVIDPGTYRLGDAANPPAALIELIGLTDFTLDGHGALFLCQAQAMFVRMDDCQRVLMKNYQLDWDWTITPVQSLGRIQSIAADGSAIDLYYPYETDPAPAPIPHELVEVAAGTYNFVHRGLGVVGHQYIKAIAAISPHVLRFTAVTPGYFAANHAAVGQYYVARHFEYEYPGTRLTGCHAITFENVITYSTLGIGYSIRHSDHLEFRDSKIIRRPNTAWPWRFSSAADGIHCENNYGYIKLLNVEIGNAGDDAINIHDTLTQGIEYIAGHPDQLWVMSPSTWQYPFAQGNTVELRRDDFSPVGFRSRLSDAPTYAHGRWTLTFADRVPPGLASDTIVFNDSYHSDNYVVRNCALHDNKVRGMVVHTGNGTIENTVFSGNYSPGLFILTAATKFREGKNPTNIIVRNNVFDRNDLKRGTFATMPNNVVIAAETPQHKPVNYGLCHDIIVEGNVIKNCPYAALEVASASHVLVANNTIVNPNRFNDRASVTGSLMVLDAHDIVVTNNRLVVDPGVQTYHTNVSVDSATTTSVYAEPLRSR